MEPAGQDLGSAHALGIDDSTAPIAAERQSFLDNVIAQFDGATLTVCGMTDHRFDAASMLLRSWH
jgi:hypothetical protein